MIFPFHSTVHGKWTDWEDEGKCNVTCGPGVKKQKRVCNVKGNGDTCNGADFHFIYCEIPCPGKKLNI